MELQKTALNKWHKDFSGKMVEFGGWEMPVQYKTGILKEHLSTRRYGGLFDVSHMGMFSISGKDGLSFLMETLSNNAGKLNIGEAQYTLIFEESGILADDAYLYRIATDNYLLVVNASNRKNDWRHLKQFSDKYRNLNFEDITTTSSIL